MSISLLSPRYTYKGKRRNVLVGCGIPRYSDNLRFLSRWFRRAPTFAPGFSCQIAPCLEPVHVGVLPRIQSATPGCLTTFFFIHHSEAVCAAFFAWHHFTPFGSGNSTH